jgi:Ni/Co efflux regulator RcnB
MLQRRNLLSVTLLGALGAVALPAMAQPRGPDHRQDERRGPDHRDDNHRGRAPQASRQPQPHAHNDSRQSVPSRYPRGVGPDRRWNRGDRIPSQYRHRQYVVDNWRAHRLSAPPRGYHWVQVGGDYALIAIATGLITQLVLSN